YNKGTDPIADGLAGNEGGPFDGPAGHEMPENKGDGFIGAYRFGHAFVPDILYFPEIGEKTVKGKTMEGNLNDLRELDGHEFIREHGLGFCFHGAMNTRAGAPVAGNYADFFNRMDTEEGIVDLFQQELIKDQKRGSPSYNDDRRSHNEMPIQSWENLFK